LKKSRRIFTIGCGGELQMRFVGSFCLDEKKITHPVGNFARGSLEVFAWKATFRFIPGLTKKIPAV
jgi:hypothetical protein